MTDGSGTFLRGIEFTFLYSGDYLSQVGGHTTRVLIGMCGLACCLGSVCTSAAVSGTCLRFAFGLFVLVDLPAHSRHSTPNLASEQAMCAATGQVGAGVRDALTRPGAGGRS